MCRRAALFYAANCRSANYITITITITYYLILQYFNGIFIGNEVEKIVEIKFKKVRFEGRKWLLFTEKYDNIIKLSGGDEKIKIFPEKVEKTFDFFSIVC
jgi:hypothetical protein